MSDLSTTSAGVPSSVVTSTHELQVPPDNSLQGNLNESHTTRTSTQREQSIANLIDHYKLLLSKGLAELQDIKDELSEKNLQVEKIKLSQSTQKTRVDEKEAEISELLKQLGKAQGN